MNITIKSDQGRYYITGNTYPIKDRLKNAGCKWDSTKKAWWTHDSAMAQSIASWSSHSPSSPPPSSSSSANKNPGKEAYVAGKATYKGGKGYYIAGRINKGKTAYDDEVDAITTRDGSKFLLYAFDGSFQFWADKRLVVVTKIYNTPQTIGGLSRFSQKLKDGGGGFAQTKRCWECGGSFTYQEAKRNGGDWADSYCGC